MKPLAPQDLERIRVELERNIEKQKKLKVTGELDSRSFLGTACAQIMLYGGYLETLAPMIATESAFLAAIAKYVGKGIKAYAKYLDVRVK